jgi:hypothetical protein
MTETIDQKIVGYRVKTQDLPKIVSEPHEALERPATIQGKTYRIKPGDHAYYITVNDIEIDGVVRPYEVFINTKDTTNFQWVMIFTRLVSAIFRKGGEYQFMIDEMKAIIDPSGGYWKKGAGYIPSLVADIGMVIEKHLSK